MSHWEPQAQPVSPSMQKMQIFWPGAMAVQAIHVAAKLALADFVANGPKSISELAEATRMHGPVDSAVLESAYGPRDLHRGFGRPVSTNHVERIPCLGL